MIKKISSPKMRNRKFIFAPKIEYELVVERSEANQNSLTFLSGARGGGRTHMTLRSQDFESCASADSATRAKLLYPF